MEQQVRPISPTSQNTLNVSCTERQEAQANIEARPLSRDEGQMQLPTDDMVDGMGAVTFADEQESGFFGQSFFKM